MKIKSNVKSGGIGPNHNETIARSKSKGLMVKTGVKAGGTSLNHNEIMLRQGRTVKTGVKAGVAPPPPTKC